VPLLFDSLSGLLGAFFSKCDGQLEPNEPNLWNQPIISPPGVAAAMCFPQGPYSEAA